MAIILSPVLAILGVLLIAAGAFAAGSCAGLAFILFGLGALSLGAAVATVGGSLVLWFSVPLAVGLLLVGVYVGSSTGFCGL